MKGNLNPMKDKGLDPKRTPRGDGPKSKKKPNTFPAPKGGPVRTPRKEGPKSKKGAVQKSPLGSDAANGTYVKGVDRTPTAAFPIRGVSGDLTAGGNFGVRGTSKSGGGNHGTRGVSV